MITQDLPKLIGEAMKKREDLRLLTLRLLSSALNYERIEKMRQLTQEEEFAVVRREIKKRKDSVEIFQKAGDTTRSEKELSEIAILEEFIPKALDNDEVLKIIDEAISETGATSIKDMGRVIGLVMKKSEGRVDGGVVSGLIKEKLSS